MTGKSICGSCGKSYQHNIPIDDRKMGLKISHEGAEVKRYTDTVTTLIDKCPSCGISGSEIPLAFLMEHNVKYILIK